MIERIDAARQWWLSRSDRERALLAVMLVAVLGVVGWYGVISPLRSAAEDSQQRVETAARKLASLKAASRENAPQPGQSAAAPQVLVEASAIKAGVPIARRRQDANGQFTIWITAIDARTLLPWVAAVEREGGVTVAD
ncbi:MAG TPA: type II secretion system protein GspM, partial [Caulobacter sp.]